MTHHHHNDKPNDLTGDLNPKEGELRKIIRDCGSLVIAYSGGVDSTLVAKIASQELGENSLMVIADSPSLARQELREALRLGKTHGFPVKVIATDEVDDPSYRANAGDRCYFCKATLYRHLEKIRGEIGFRFLANGDHLEDGFVHRPGRKAAQEKRVRSPLAEAGFTKSEVRSLAEKLGLPNHDKPSSPCLSSRILTGTEVTPEKLRQVEAAENFFKTRWGIREIRVRHWGEQAQIETLPEFFPIIEEHTQDIENFLLTLGFKSWSLSPHPLKSGTFSQIHREPRSSNP